jgi:hypothetical protein
MITLLMLSNGLIMYLIHLISPVLCTDITIAFYQLSDIVPSYEIMFKNFKNRLSNNFPAYLNKSKLSPSSPGALFFQYII